MIWNIYLFIAETLILQGLAHFQNWYLLQIYKTEKNVIYLKKLYAFIITIFTQKNSKIHLHEKVIFEQKDMQSIFEVTFTIGSFVPICNIVFITFDMVFGFIEHICT
jgi:hypothetical protein